MTIKVSINSVWKCQCWFQVLRSFGLEHIRSHTHSHTHSVSWLLQHVCVPGGDCGCFLRLKVSHHKAVKVHVLHLRRLERVWGHVFKSSLIDFFPQIALWFMEVFRQNTALVWSLLQISVGGSFFFSPPGVGGVGRLTAPAGVPRGEDSKRNLMA